MMCVHLELGQLWRCLVDWCAVWKGSVKECREHFNDKHCDSATLDFASVSRSFPPWTVPRELWQMALQPEVSGIVVDVRLFHEAGSRLVHKYRVYKDPLRHPALRGGVIPKLLLFVGRAMAIAQLTQLRISIPSSGAPPGEVPADYFPSTDSSAVTSAPRRVTFAPEIPTLMEDTQLQWTDMDRSPATATDTETRPKTPPVTSEMTISPPPGFPQFQTRSTHRRRPRRPLKREFKQEKPARAEDFLFGVVPLVLNNGVPVHMLPPMNLEPTAHTGLR